MSPFLATITSFVPLKRSIFLLSRIGSTSPVFGSHFIYWRMSFWSPFLEDLAYPDSPDHSCNPQQSAAPRHSMPVRLLPLRNPPILPTPDFSVHTAVSDRRGRQSRIDFPEYRSSDPQERFSEVNLSLEQEISQQVHMRGLRMNEFTGKPIACFGRPECRGNTGECPRSDDPRWWIEV